MQFANNCVTKNPMFLKVLDTCKNSFLRLNICPYHTVYLHRHAHSQADDT